MINAISDLVDQNIMLMILKIGKIYNKRFVHLTNNCIQVNDKNFNKSDIPGNMWTST